jgi:hypothetical protein
MLNRRGLSILVHPITDDPVADHEVNPPWLGEAVAVVSAPVVGRDYPTSWRQFLEWFPDEAACAQYLYRLRWAKGFGCRACGVVAEPGRATRNRFVCRSRA